MEAECRDISLKAGYRIEGRIKFIELHAPTS